MPNDLSRRRLLQMLAATPMLPMMPGIAPVFAARADATPRRLQIGMVSRHLQWTNLEDAIELAAQMGFDAIEWNVRSGAHIPPERVEQELPKAIELTKKAGMVVPMITTSIQDPRSPYTEAILRTASGLGVKYYRGGEYFRYDYNGDLANELEALKPGVAALAQLNEKYGLTFAYHTHSGRGNIGGNVWDFWTVIKDLDPRFVGFNYDTGHTTARGGNGWMDAAHVVSKHISALAVKDFAWARRADGTWVTEWCPIGQGMVDFQGILRFLKTINFAGPVNVHYEHSNLLGTDVGTWKLDMSRERFVAVVKRDLDSLRALIQKV